MIGDYTRFTHDPQKHYSRVLKQQGRVDLDADWNEAIEIFTHHDRVESTDVIGQHGVPKNSNGLKVNLANTSDLTIQPGRIYVDGILATFESDPSKPDEPISITNQPDLPGYELPKDNAVYRVYADVWERHITYIEDPEIKEVALGGPDTTTRTKIICQVKLAEIDDDQPWDQMECQEFNVVPSNGTLCVQTDLEAIPSKPCVVGSEGGYRGLENRLYRVEIHDNGRNNLSTPTFKWSRDNGTITFPIDSISKDGTKVTLKHLGMDEVLTVKVGDWVEIIGDETELHGKPGTLARIMPNGIDQANLKITLSKDVSVHADEAHLKMRRWDHHDTIDLSVEKDGALPIQSEWFELEDGIQVKFELNKTCNVGDYWLIPARTREGSVLWPKENKSPKKLPPFGIHHHYCTLALARRSGGEWVDVRDCRPLFPSLTGIDEGCCCIRVNPGENIQQAIDKAIKSGGGCVSLCQGVHEVNKAIRIQNARDIKVTGMGTATVLKFNEYDSNETGILIENSQRIDIENMFITSTAVNALITVQHDEKYELNRGISLRGLTLLNIATSLEPELRSAIRLSHTDGVTIQDCRIAAEAGVACTWGNSLPDISQGRKEEPDQSVSLSFDQLGVRKFKVSDKFEVSGVEIVCESFGESQNGSATVNQINGQTNWGIFTSNISLNFKIQQAFRSVLIHFSYHGGSLTLDINGDLKNFKHISSLENEIIIGGVIVKVQPQNDKKTGIITLTQESKSIRSLVIGGQELWIESILFRDPVITPSLNYGECVSNLVMRETTIRYDKYGVLSPKCDRWVIDSCDIQPFNPDSWKQLKTPYTKLNKRMDYSSLLSSMGLMMNNSSIVTSTGIGILSFFWCDCELFNNRISGSYGVIAALWIRGKTDKNIIIAKDTGMSSFWFHDTVIKDNRINSPGGTCISAIGCYKNVISQNQLRGLVGFSNLPLSILPIVLIIICNVFLYAYGAKITLINGFVLFWMLTEETIKLIGFRELFTELQKSIKDNAGDFPLSVFFSYVLLIQIITKRGSRMSEIGIPIIDLHILQNDISCQNGSLMIKNFIPLGSIRISDNRIHTVAGRAVSVEAHNFFPNPHLTVFLYRAMVNVLLGQVNAAIDNKQEMIFKIAKKILVKWQQDSEEFLTPDLRIESNTIQSLLTAIESNLFELALVNNHITLKERPMFTEQNYGSIYGSILDSEDEKKSLNAIVRVDGMGFAENTINGKYCIGNLPSGTYTLHVSANNYKSQSLEMTLFDGEKTNVDFNMDQIEEQSDNILKRGFDDIRFSNFILTDVSSHNLALNSEIQQVVKILKESESDAFEPAIEAFQEMVPIQVNNHADILTESISKNKHRKNAANTIAQIGCLTSDTKFAFLCNQLKTSIINNEKANILAWMQLFLSMLQGYKDSQGILLKGFGCRISENHIIVPKDVNPETQALGGVQISVDYSYLYFTVHLGKLLQQFLKQKDDVFSQLDPLLGITETLIDNNEIIGGIGHGISIQSPDNQPDFIQDLRICGNQILGFAGCGIYNSENSIVIGLTIDHNHISECGKENWFTKPKGGIVVRNAAICHLHGNHILRCGDGVTGTGIFGVDLESIYNLKFTENELVANGSNKELPSLDDCALSMQEVYGSIMLNNNTFSYNRGPDLYWANSAKPDEMPLLSKILFEGINRYLRNDYKIGQMVKDELASIQNNIIKGQNKKFLPILILFNIGCVSLSGNTCDCTFEQGLKAAMGEIKNITYGIVSNNHLYTNADEAIAIWKMKKGVVFGNVGSSPIKIISSDVKQQLNIPEII